MTPETETWRSTNRSNPYQNEWDLLIAKIRNDEPHNEVERGVYASLTCSMGRRAAHTGQEVTFDQMLNSQQEFAPDVDSLNYETPSPLMPGADGLYPVPEPGRKGEREY